MLFQSAYSRSLFCETALSWFASRFGAQAAKDFNLRGTASVRLYGIGERPLPTLWANDLHFVDPLVADFAPDIVILEIGINDLSREGMGFSGLSLTTAFGYFSRNIQSALSAFVM